MTMNPSHDQAQMTIDASYRPVLDHGYVKYVDHMGSDERIIEAARQSTGKGFLSWLPQWQCPSCRGPLIEAEDSPGFCDNDHSLCAAVPYEKLHNGDAKLLKFLWTKQHTTPFETPAVTVQVQAPIMVYREWHRHRTQSYNEMSARYVPLPDVNYVPTVDRCMMGVKEKANKQATAVDGAAELTPDLAATWLTLLGKGYQACESIYQDGLNAGIPKELARLILPVGRYSRMMATANLLNWLRFLRLRCAPDAQWEIRQFAEGVRSILTTLFPRTLTLFNESMDKLKVNV